MQSAALIPPDIAICRLLSVRLSGHTTPAKVRTGRLELVTGKHGPNIEAMVMSKTEQELRKEMDKTASELCCAAFWCYFIAAFEGIKHLKRAREYSSKGKNIEARDALLDAKISHNKSCCIGGIVCWGILQGIFVMLLLPFIWIPYLIVIA